MDIEMEWKKIIETLAPPFGEELDMQGILFLIGVQELGTGKKKFSKDQKLDILHVAICTLLAPYGYYELEGRDADGWPHWKFNERLPALKSGEQLALIKRAIIDYFNTEK
ncbi:MAG TPA: hypothetical protein VNG53_03760 [Bacteroidia bacterium]|nr:hypothetical protein [Bacteroidia bacterium]